ncbi:MAG: type II toxin-antitoxin system RelE/ParE family toxin [Bacteriovoracia bacterium]
MDLVILSQCKRELDDFPLGVREELLDALACLREGIELRMPLSRKMKGMGEGVFELRFRDPSGIYRVIYLVRRSDAIYLIHGFKKTSQRTSRKDIEVSLGRIKRFL